MKKLLLFILIGLFFFNSCHKDTPNEPAAPEQDASISSDLKVLSQDQKKQLLSVSLTQDTIIFNGSVAGLAKDNIIAADVGEGVLRRIRDIKFAGNRTFVFTDQASMVEAFRSLSITDSFDISASMLENTDFNMRGVRLGKGSNNNELKFEFKDAVVYDFDGNPFTNGDQITATGEIIFQLKPKFELKISDSQVQKLKISASPTGIVSLSFNVPIEFPELKPEPKLIATIKTTPTIISIAGVPVVITNQIPLYLGFSGKTKLNLSTGIKNTVSLSVGVNYENGQWQPFSGFSNNFEFNEPSLNGECKLKVYIEPRLEMKLYGVVGPRINVQGFAEGEGIVSVSPLSGKSDISAALYGGVEAGIGVIMKILDWRITSYDSPPLIQEKVKLWEKKWALNFAPAEPSNPSPNDNASNQATNVNLSWTCSDQEKDPLLYDLYFDQTNPPATKLSSLQSVSNYNVTGLTKGIKYYWQVFAKDDHGNIKSGPVWSFSTTTLLEAPSGLTASAISSSEVALSWKDNSTDEMGFYIEQRTGSNGAWQQIGQCSADATKYSALNLSPQTQYYFRVQAFSSNERSWYSNFVTVTTPEPSIPYAPSDLTAMALSTTSIKLSWKDISGNEAGFRIERKKDSGEDWLKIAEVGSNTTTFTDNELISNTLYYYRVFSFNNNGTSDPSNTASARTGNTVPNPPSDLTATFIPPGSIYLHWKDNSQNEKGFIVYATCCGGDKPFEPLELSKPDLTETTISYANMGQTYKFNVAAYNEIGTSYKSNSATVTNIPAPKGLYAVILSSSQVRLEWDHEEYREKYIRIWKKLSSSSSWGNSTTINVNYGSINSYIVSNLTPNTRYDFRIARINIDGYVSDYSNITSVTTLTAGAIITGKVTDSQNGGPIANATVEGDEGQKTTTQSDGTYALEVNEGNRKITVSKTGFYSYFKNCSAVNGKTQELNFVLSKLLDKVVNRIVLSWGDQPKDLDLHVLTPSINGKTYEVYFKYMGSANNPPNMVLDIDDTTSYGPETITVYKLFQGTYKVFIHNYSEYKKPGSTLISSSQATVDIYSKSGLLNTLTVPSSGSGKVWYVCDINGSTGEITVINRIQDNFPSLNLYKTVDKYNK